MDLEAALQRARTPDELVWHYTTLETLALILQSNSILATEVSFQNDIRETLTADDAFSNALNKLRNDQKYGSFAEEALDYLEREDNWLTINPSPVHELTRNARFILCGAGDPDSLYAWRTYSQDGIGCAIGLDSDVALGVVDATAHPHRVRHWRKVVYSPTGTTQVALRVLKRLGDRWLQAAHDDAADDPSMDAFGVIVLNLVEARSQVRAIAKDPAFSDEDERRVTVETVSQSSLITTPSSMGPRPQVRLVTSQGGRWGESAIRADIAPPLPIRAIRLGPNAPDSAFAAAQWLLYANGYQLDPVRVDEGDPSPHAEITWESSVVIDKSEHPYRAR